MLLVSWLAGWQELQVTAARTLPPARAYTLLVTQRRVTCAILSIYTVRFTFSLIIQSSGRIVVATSTWLGTIVLLMIMTRGSDGQSIRSGKCVGKMKEICHTHHNFSIENIFTPSPCSLPISPSSLFPPASRCSNRCSPPQPKKTGIIDYDGTWILYLFSCTDVWYIIF